MNSSTTLIEKNFYGMALIIAPILFAASTFFWIKGEYGVAAGTLGIISLFFWIPALTSAFSLLKNKMPRYAIYGLWIAVFGCISKDRMHSTYSRPLVIDTNSCNSCIAFEEK